MQLQIIATALGMNTSQNEQGACWTMLYDKYGRLTFGQLRREISRQDDFGLSEDLAEMLEQAVSIRNRLAHHFFRAGIIQNQTALSATRELQSSASLLRHVSTQLSQEVDALLNRMHTSRMEAQAQLEKSRDTKE